MFLSSRSTSTTKAGVLSRSREPGLPIKSLLGPYQSTIALPSVLQILSGTSPYAPSLPSPAIVAVPAAVGLLPTAFGGPAHAPSGDAPMGATSELARRPIGQRTTDESLTVS